MNSIAEYQTILTSINTLMTNIMPTVLRFYNFIATHDTVENLRSNIEDDTTGDFISLYKFEFIVNHWQEDKAYVFMHEEAYDHDVHTYFLVIPFAYFEDPDAWEAVNIII